MFFEIQHFSSVLSAVIVPWPIHELRKESGLKHGKADGGKLQGPCNDETYSSNLYTSDSRWWYVMVVGTIRCMEILSACLAGPHNTAPAEARAHAHSTFPHVSYQFRVAFCCVKKHTERIILPSVSSLVHWAQCQDVQPAQSTVPGPLHILFSTTKSRVMGRLRLSHASGCKT